MRALILVLVAACGSSSSVPVKHDAPIDVPADSTLDAPPVPVGPHYHYVIDQEFIPTNNTQARTYGLDLDGNGTVDNQLGLVFGTLASMGFDVQGETNTAVDQGSILMLADLQTNDFMYAQATGFTIYFGANPTPPACNGSGDTVCRHHLTGSASFDVAASSPRDPELYGKAVGGTFSQGPGNLSVQVMFLGTQVDFALIGARVRLAGVTATAIGSSAAGGGILAGAVTQSDLNNRVLPEVQQGMVPIIVRDCCGAGNVSHPTCDPSGTPPCGCVDGTTGKTLLGLFDTNPKDCAVSVSEIQNNSLIQSLLAPDVTIDGQMALSFGVKVTAVGATFTP